MAEFSNVDVKFNSILLIATGQFCPAWIELVDDKILLDCLAVSSFVDVWWAGKELKVRQIVFKYSWIPNRMGAVL